MTDVVEHPLIISYLLQFETTFFFSALFLSIWPQCEL